MKAIIIQDHSIAYRDEGKGEVVIFVHGTPSSSLEFEDIIHQLKNNYRCIALDHLGFGESNKPKDGDYSLSAHSFRFLEFLDKLQIERFHLVIHDFGGAIALPVAIKRHHQIQSLTVLNSWIWPFFETEPQILKQRWLMTSTFMKYLYLHWNFSARFLVKMSWGSYKPLKPERHKQYQSYFRSPDERHGTVGFLNALFDFTHEAWRVHEELKVFSNIPVFIVWGQADKLISLKSFQRWKEIFPNAKVRLLPKVGHFVADEGSEFVVATLNELSQRLTTV